MKERPEVVVVTGGTAGVGRAVVRAFAMQGADIGIIARNCERLNATKYEVEKIGSRAVVVSADVSQADQVERAASEIEQVLGPITIWINNAVVSIFSPFLEMMPDEFKRVTDVTYHGCVYGTMAALRRMLPRDHGTIVQVGSTLAYRSIPLGSAVCGAKHANVGFTDSIRSELMHNKSKVHVTMVHLPSVNTPQFDWARSNLARKARPPRPVFQPEVAARAIVWAARQKRREVYVGARTTGTAWGQKFIPGLFDRYLARTSYKAQLTDLTEDSYRRDNLYESFNGDYEAHGSFDRGARSRSPALTFTKYKYRIAWALIATGMAGVIGSIIHARKHDKQISSFAFRPLVKRAAAQPAAKAADSRARRGSLKAAA